MKEGDMDGLTSIALVQAKSALKGPMEALGKAATGAVKERWRKWKNQKNVETLARKARAITHVKTLWNVEKETSLFDFYYPSRVQFSESITKRVESLSGIGRTGNFVIQGIVGQGKSIFLRYLYGQELRPSTSSDRIPIFVELRRVNNGKSLKATLFDAFTRLGFDIDDEMLSWYAESGRIVFLLDAFDEIDQEFVADALSDMEGLAAQFPALQMIVTSRPDAAIQNSSAFRVLKLAPLTPNDHLPFLERICVDSTQAARLHQAISSSTTDIRGLLQTPLLMTLLVILYKAQAFIPHTVAAFYEQLFDTLFLRHDRGKPGFSRERHTKLDDDQVKSLFEALCFRIRVEGRVVLKMDEFRKCLDIAKRACGVSVDTWKFRDELVKTTCLLQEEGVELSFIHKSVLEFHAAAFIKNASEDVAKAFYTAAQTDVTFNHPWEEELRFLRDIDTYRYSRYFFLPSVQEMLTRLNIDEASGKVPMEALQTSPLKSLQVIGWTEGDALQLVGWAYATPYSFVEQMLLQRCGSELAKICLPPPETVKPTERDRDPSGKPQLRFDVRALLDDPGYKEAVANALSKGVKKLLEEKNSAKRVVALEDEKLDLMSKTALS